MTRDEFIEELRKRRDQCGFTAGEEAYGVAMELAEQLDSPPAMAWQDEPSATGLHYVEGLSVPVLLIRDANRPDRPWTYWDAKYSRSERVGSRRVCPIPSPPELTKRGDA